MPSIFSSSSMVIITRSPVRIPRCTVEAFLSCSTLVRASAQHVEVRTSIFRLNRDRRLVGIPGKQVCEWIPTQQFSQGLMGKVGEVLTIDAVFPSPEYVPLLFCPL